MTTDMMTILTNAVAALSEHFDNVRIFASRTAHGHTETFTAGAGNFMAQIGQVERWRQRIEFEHLRDLESGDDLHWET